MRGLLYFSIFLTSLNAYNILVYSPAYATSHSIFMGKLADTLTDAGHNVTLLIPVVNVLGKNTTGVKTTKDVVFFDLDEIAEESPRAKKAYFSYLANLWIQIYEAEDFEKTFSILHKKMIKICANLIQNIEIFDEMKSRNFDVVLIEPMSICGVGFAYRLGIEKLILTSSCTVFDFMHEHLGEPAEYSYVPSIFGQTSDQMNLMERYENFKMSYYCIQTMNKVFDEEERIYTQNYQIYIPPWRELLAASSLYFTNANPNIDFPRPTIQKTIFIGGVSVDMDDIRSRKLDDEWEKLLEMREKTMLISFGSIVRSEHMPITYRETLLRVIESLPDVTFIWKYESDETKWAKHVENVHFFKWVPQTALLNDKRVTAFLTHGGLGSTNELAYSGKPALMVPISFDQTRNTKMYARLGSAITIKKTDLDNYELVRRSIQSILYDESYTKNAQSIANILENQPVKPKDLVVKYTEFVARFGPFPNMDPYVRHLNFIQRVGLDVLAIWYSGHILGFLFIVIMLKLIFSRLLFSRNKKKIV